jgi:hypothetical protein
MSGTTKVKAHVRGRVGECVNVGEVKVSGRDGERQEDTDNVEL